MPLSRRATSLPCTLRECVNFEAGPGKCLLRFLAKVKPRNTLFLPGKQMVVLVKILCLFNKVSQPYNNSATIQRVIDLLTSSCDVVEVESSK